MRYYYNGSAFTVSYSREDAHAFAKQWPCSTVEGRGSFQFAANGDLIDMGGSAAKNDGPDWLAFSQDCQAYGTPKFAKDRKRRQDGYQHEPV